MRVVGYWLTSGSYAASAAKSTNARFLVVNMGYSFSCVGVVLS